MANIGLRKPIIAKMTSATAYAAPFLCGKAIGIQVVPNFSEGSLNADDTQAEYDKQFNYADVTLNTSSLPIKAHEEIFGHTVTEDEEVTYDKDDEQNYVGMGWISVERIDGVKKYVGNVLTKCKFAEPSEDYATKGDSIEYKTPSISGRAMANDAGKWKHAKPFATESEAMDYVYKKFGHTYTEAPESV